jgi:hypothetical protein
MEAFGGSVDFDGQGQFSGINKSPRALVLLLLVPDYLVIFAYLVLCWQLLSLYYDGHANIFRSIWVGCGIYFISIMACMFIITLSVFVVLYLNNLIKAHTFAIQLISLNWGVPGVMFLIMLYFAFKFSGSPIKSEQYSLKIKSV